jgi:hypothetical protein
MAASRWFLKRRRAQRRSPIVESTASSSLAFVSGEQTNRPCRPNAPVPCEGAHLVGPRYSAPHRIAPPRRGPLMTEPGVTTVCDEEGGERIVSSKRRRGRSQPSGDVQNAVKRNRWVLVLRQLGLYFYRAARQSSSSHLPVPGLPLLTTLGSDLAGAMAEKVITGRRPCHSKPGFRRLRLSKAATRTPWSFQRSARGRDETPRSSEGDAPHAQISSRDLFPEICAQCRWGAHWGRDQNL